MLGARARRARLRRGAAGAIGLGLLGCGRDDAAPLPGPVETPPPAVAEEASPYDGIELPPFEPLPLSPPELLPLRPLAPPGDESGDPAGAPVPEAPLPLDALLRVPATPPPVADPAPRRLDLGALPPDEPTRPAAPGALGRLRERVHVERRSEAIGPAGPRQGTRREIDAGLRVPLDESVSVEGGVRVDERDEPGAAEAERKSSPRVGVKVRF